jgi:hypothetical protein
VVARWCVSSSGVFCARPIAPARAPALTFALTHFFHAHTHALALWTAGGVDASDETKAMGGYKDGETKWSRGGASAAAASFAPALLRPRAPPP